MAKIEAKGQRSCEIWQSLKKDLKAHGFVIIILRKLIFGRVISNMKYLCPFVPLNLPSRLF